MNRPEQYVLIRHYGYYDLNDCLCITNNWNEVMGVMYREIFSIFYDEETGERTNYYISSECEYDSSYGNRWYWTFKEKGSDKVVHFYEIYGCNNNVLKGVIDDE